MKGETEKETEHRNYKLQGELTLLSLKVFTAVLVLYWGQKKLMALEMTAIKFSIQKVRKNTEDPGDSQKEWQGISNTGHGSQNWVNNKCIMAVTHEKVLQFLQKQQWTQKANGVSFLLLL